MTSVGISGHQDRPGIDWDWVRKSIATELDAQRAQQALSSLAAGSDQVFADVAVGRGCQLEAVLPMPDYRARLSGDAQAEYDRLLGMSKVTTLPGAENDEQAYFNAGAYIVDYSDVLVAIWDERPAKGFGGTADVVKYALEKGRRIVVLNPIKRERHQFN
jgi:hypothetical protein